MRLCVTWFCKIVCPTLRYRLFAAKAIDMVVVPDAGDLRGGYARWRFILYGSDTRVEFSAGIEPKFRMPSGVGPYLVRRALKRQRRITADSIQRLAVHDRKEQ